jgi:hypothetical protein
MSNWVDFAALKQIIPLSVVLRQYEVALRRSGRHQYRGICPIHRGEGPEAFHANLRRNLFHCFSCGAGGTVLDFIAAMEGCTLLEAARKLQSMAALPASATPAALGKPRVTKKIISPLGFTLRGIDSAHPYLAGRGITQATAAEFGIGFYPGSGILSGRLVIPIHNQRGELVAYAGRSLDRTQPRYRFPGGFAKSEVLFNLHRAAAVAQPTVVVVEGFFDCLKVQGRNRGGGGADGYRAVPIAAARLVGTFPDSHPDAGWRFRRPPRHGYHCRPAPTSCFGPCDSPAPIGAAGPTFGRGLSAHLAGALGPADVLPNLLIEILKSSCQPQCR